MKRKIMSLLVALCLTLALFPAVPAAAAAPVNVTINGVPVQFNQDTGVPFIDSNGRTQVPLRAAMEAMGADVGWNNYDRAASVVRNGGFILDENGETSYCASSVIIPIGEKFIYIDGERTPTDTVALIKDGRTYLPIRAVAEALGAEVIWHGNSRTVAIQIPPKQDESYYWLSGFIGNPMGDIFSAMGYCCGEGWDDETDSPSLVYEKYGIWFCLEMDGPNIICDSPSTYHHPQNKVIAVKSTSEYYICNELHGRMTINELVDQIVTYNYDLISEGYYEDEDGYSKSQYRAELSVPDEWTDEVYSLTYVWVGDVPGPDTKSSYAVLRAN